MLAVFGVVVPMSTPSVPVTETLVAKKVENPDWKY
jgi:hypothetical protein